jgi:hypothetical protein
MRSLEAREVHTHHIVIKLEITTWNNKAKMEGKYQMDFNGND